MKKLTITIVLLFLIMVNFAYLPALKNAEASNNENQNLSAVRYNFKRVLTIYNL